MDGLQGKIPIKTDDLGVSLFQETSILSIVRCTMGISES